MMNVAPTTKYLLAVLTLTISLVSCKPERPFNKTEWRKRDDLGTYPYRNQMIEDLIENYQLKGISYQKVIDLLGNPDHYSMPDSSSIYYNIVTDYGHDIDPVYRKDLMLSLDTVSKVVVDVSLKEHKH